ncbi:MAG: SPOR domain-containing protein [Magnetococcus sp. WYHC-3]
MDKNKNKNYGWIHSTRILARSATLTTLGVALGGCMMWGSPRELPVYYAPGARLTPPASASEAAATADLGQTDAAQPTPAKTAGDSQSSWVSDWLQGDDSAARVDLVKQPRAAEATTVSPAKVTPVAAVIPAPASQTSWFSASRSRESDLPVPAAPREEPVAPPITPTRALRVLEVAPPPPVPTTMAASPEDDPPLVIRQRPGMAPGFFEILRETERLAAAAGNRVPRESLEMARTLEVPTTPPRERPVVAPSRRERIEETIREKLALARQLTARSAPHLEEAAAPEPTPVARTPEVPPVVALPDVPPLAVVPEVTPVAALPQVPPQPRDNAPAPDAPPVVAVITREVSWQEAARAIDNGIPPGELVIRTASFTRLENAERMRKRLEELGFTARVNTVERDGQSFHRVVVGPFLDQDDARNSARMIRQTMGLVDAFITAWKN